jgi:hypothetical protein
MVYKGSMAAGAGPLLTPDACPYPAAANHAKFITHTKRTATRILISLT